MMIVFAACLLISNVLCQDVYENNTEVDFQSFENNNFNTALYPVENVTTLASEEKEISKNDRKEGEQAKDQRNHTKNIRTQVTSWNINATLKEPKVLESEDDIITSDSKEVAVFQSNDNTFNKNNKTDVEFKPSPSLESYYDLDNFDKPHSTKNADKHFAPMFNDFRNKPKFREDDLFNPSANKIKFPKGDENNRPTHPYKFERQYPEGFHKWKSSQPDSKPTVEYPVSIPAGGLYKVPFALHNDKPDTFERDKDFEQFHSNEFQEHKQLKKKHNPWKGLLHLITALLPVGLIVSALSPNIITIDNVQDQPKLVRKRSPDDGHQFSRPVEACKKRLLCELYGPHTDSAVELLHSSPPIRRKDYPPEQPCSEYPCSDPRAMTELVTLVRKQLRIRRPWHQQENIPGKT